MEEPLEGLIERIHEYKDFSVAASDSVSETNTVRIAYGLVAETDHYPRYCRSWMTQYDKS